MSIQAYFPPEKRVYNINLIFDLQTRNVKWESQKGPKLTGDEFNNVLKSSILELKLANGQNIPNSKISTEFEHFYLDFTSQMFKDQSNYSIVYNTDTNSATFTIMPQSGKSGNYNIYGFPVDSKSGNGRGGRPRRCSTFRQRRLKRPAAKSRRATRRATRRRRV
jgi:hypothetical protein